jgi:hypothetical protein
MLPENSRIWEISRNLGAGDTSAMGRLRRKCTDFYCTRVSEDSVNPISIFVESLLGLLCRMFHNALQLLILILSKLDQMVYIRHSLHFYSYLCGAFSPQLKC